MIENSEGFNILKYSPIEVLVNCNNLAIQTFTRHDILDEHISLSSLWQMSTPQKILKKQESNGSWKYSKKLANTFLQNSYDQYQTFKQLAILVEMYGYNNSHPAIEKTAEYFFSLQTVEGDFRGIYGNQYTPNFSAAIVELLIKTGYEDDPRIEKFFKWIISVRQSDGGWAIPFRTKGHGIGIIYENSRAVLPDLLKPFSYMVTGVVLRAFAAHPKYSKAKEAHIAGELLISRIFKKDNYPDRGNDEYWLRFSYPFDYTHLISCLDSLSQLGFSANDSRINDAMQWFVDNQNQDGTWDFRIVRGSKKDNINLWLTLSVCRIIKRLY